MCMYLFKYIYIYIYLSNTNTYIYLFTCDNPTQTHTHIYNIYISDSANTNICTYQMCHRRGALSLLTRSLTLISIIFRLIQLNCDGITPIFI